MNIGRLDRRIEIGEDALTKNELGESVGVWSVYHLCFANVQMNGGGEREESDKITSTQKLKFKIRFFAGITEKMRILYNGSYYDITQIQELGREGLWIYANKKD